jgi:hypothetical protein
MNPTTDHRIGASSSCEGIGAHRSASLPNALLESVRDYERFIAWARAVLGVQCEVILRGKDERGHDIGTCVVGGSPWMRDVVECLAVLPAGVRVVRSAA